jgi:hypothetical protein
MGAKDQSGAAREDRDERIPRTTVRTRGNRPGDVDRSDTSVPSALKHEPGRGVKGDRRRTQLSICTELTYQPPGAWVTYTW